MLFDFISAEKLPWILVWIEWNYYAYSRSLFVISVASITHYWIGSKFHSFSGVTLSLFLGFCLWNVWCAARYGYAVG